MQFPDSCDLGNNHYLFYTASGQPQIAKGNYKLAELLPASEQRGLQKDISECFEDMGRWASRGKMKFAEEFSYLGGIQYSAPILFEDKQDGDTALKIDIIEIDDESPDTLKKTVEALDGFDENADNDGLFREEFTKAQLAWAPYVQADINTSVHFNGEEIKGVDQLPKYEYRSLTLTTMLGAAGLSIAGMFMFFAGPASYYRGGGYDRRAQERRDRIEDIKKLSGLDNPIL